MEFNTDIKSKEMAKELTKKITDFVNSYSLKSEQFNDAMSREHRTLQQSFTRLCFKWLEYVASEEYRTDGRNAASRELCQEIIDTYTSMHNYLPSQSLPLI